MEVGKPGEMHFMLSICQRARRRSILFIYESHLSCEYLRYVIIVIILPGQILRTTKYLNLPGALTNINKRTLVSGFSPPPSQADTQQIRYSW